MLNAVEIAKQQRALHQGRCFECGSQALVTDKDSGEVACNHCGLVIKEVRLTQKPEWRAFTPEERAVKNRVGAPTSLMKFDNLSTIFDPYTDAYGKPLSMKKRMLMLRLRKWQIRAGFHSSARRNLSQAINVLTRLSDKLHIPKDVIENAALIYRRALKERLVRGRSIEGIAAAALYAACRLTRTPRSLKAIVETSTRSRKEISRDYRLIQKELGIKMPIDDPLKFVPKIASRARLNQRTQNLAIELLQQTKKKMLVVGKAPAGIAAAALYIASIMNEEKITQKVLAQAAKVTEVTVRNRYKRLMIDLNLRID
jgi:transcription initiation factor TFIIB